MSLNFKKVKEDFGCEHCGAEVVGDGYTNHCPKCLWSKHVDNTPGDRANDCCGLMKPEKVEMVNSEFVLSHQCQKCGAIKKNRAGHHDNLACLLPPYEQAILGA